MNKDKKITVIYHSADFDGLFCREIARKFLRDAELIGWDYGNPKLPVPKGVFYILDLSPECLEEGASYAFDQCIWIDHHKSAIDKFNPLISGYRIDGVAACRLAWQWFNPMDAEGPLPKKQDYIDRVLSEPHAVQLAGEYDIWDKRNPDAEVFQLGLRSKELDAADWRMLLAMDSKPSMEMAELAASMGIKDFLRPDGLAHPRLISRLLKDGELIQRYQRSQDSFAMNSAFLVEFEGLKFLALNTPAKSSLAFLSRDVPETGHDALLKFNWNGHVWDCSLYHAKHRTELDLSAIAVKHGGGGHRGACGFRAATLPFLGP